MAKVFLIYESETGNTKAMAEAVMEGIQQEGVTVQIKKVEDATVDDLLEPDGIVIGCPTYFAAVPSKIKKFIDESIKHWGKLEGKVGAAFASCGDLGGGAETTILDILRAFLVHGMIIQGNLSGGHYGPISVGPPTEERREICVAFGRRFARLVNRLVQNPTKDNRKGGD